MIQICCWVNCFPELFIVNKYHLLLQLGFCFGFVEFEEASAVEKAIEVHSVYALLQFSLLKTC